MKDSLTGICALVLAGGKGERLRTLVADRPKPLAPVLGRPFIAFVLDQLAASGCRRAVISTGHLGEMFPQALGAAHGPMELAYSHEDSPLGTAGAARLALPLLTSDPVLVVNGDSYAEADLGAFAAWFSARNVPAGLVAAGVADASRYGRLDVDPQGNVRAFLEKSGHAGPGLVNAGVYLLRQSLIAAIPGNACVSIEYDVFAPLAGKGLSAWETKGDFLDIGTPLSYSRAQQFFQARTALHG